MKYLLSNYQLKDGSGEKVKIYRIHSRTVAGFKRPSFSVVMDIDEKVWNNIQIGEIVKGTWRYE